MFFFILCAMIYTIEEFAFYRMNFCAACQNAVLADLPFNMLCAQALSCRVCNGRSIDAKAIVSSVSTFFDTDEAAAVCAAMLTEEDAPAVCIERETFDRQLGALKEREESALCAWREASRTEKSTCATLEVIRCLKYKMQAAAGEQPVRRVVDTGHMSKMKRKKLAERTTEE